MRHLCMRWPSNDQSTGERRHPHVYEAKVYLFAAKQSRHTKNRVTLPQTTRTKIWCTAVSGLEHICICIQDITSALADGRHQAQDPSPRNPCCCRCVCITCQMILICSDVKETTTVQHSETRLVPADCMCRHQIEPSPGMVDKLEWAHDD